LSHQRPPEDNYAPCFCVKYACICPRNSSSRARSRILKELGSAPCICYRGAAVVSNSACMNDFFQTTILSPVSRKKTNSPSPKYPLLAEEVEPPARSLIAPTKAAWQPHGPLCFRCFHRVPRANHPDLRSRKDEICFLHTTSEIASVQFNTTSEWFL
jgi:hypothetical protein